MSAGRIVAVIDVGSNSVRLLVARQLTPTAFEVIDEESFEARLGRGQANGVLAAEAIERGLTAIRVMSQVAAAHRPASTVVVGTEALRRAANAGGFLAEVERQTGHKVRILTGGEEAFAGFLGVVNSTSLSDGAIIDLGGGSLEFMRIRERRLVEVRSAPLGAIYATERFFKSDPPQRSEVRALRAAVREHVGRPREKEPVLYGVGGSIRNLARIIRIRRGYPLRQLHGLILNRPDIDRLAAALVAGDAASRRRIPGLKASRVDILPAAAVVVAEVMEAAGSTSLVVSGQGLREGLVWQALRPKSQVIADVRGASVEAFARATGARSANARMVAKVAADLFDASTSLHHLPAADKEMLQAAARIADVGLSINYYDRERHAQYLVRSAGLHGFTHREIALLGALIRAADGGSTDLSSDASLLEPGDQQRVAVLAALLATARATGRRAPSPVTGVHAEVARATLTITLAGRPPFDPERTALERQLPALEAALGVGVRIRVAEEG